MHKENARLDATQTTILFWFEKEQKKCEEISQPEMKYSLKRILWDRAQSYCSLQDFV